MRLLPILMISFSVKHGDDFIGIVLQYILEGAEISDKIALIELINTNISYEIGLQQLTWFLAKYMQS